MVATQERRSILELVATGKITAEEAERLLAAVETGAPQTALEPVEMGRTRAPKYLRVVVEQEEDGEPLKVNIRVPLQLLRAGVRLASLIPPRATEEIDTALARQGIAFNVAQLKPENLDELIDQLRDLTIDIDQQKDRLKVRIFCE